VAVVDVVVVVVVVDVVGFYRNVHFVLTFFFSAHKLRPHPPSMLTAHPTYACPVPPAGDHPVAAGSAELGQVGWLERGLRRLAGKEPAPASSDRVGCTPSNRNGASHACGVQVRFPLMLL